MPMVGRGDEHGVQRLLQNFVIVPMSGRGAVRALLDGIAARPVDVAHGHDLVVADPVGGVEQVAHAAAGADHSDAEGVVGAQDSRGRQGGQPAGRPAAR